MKPWFGSFAMSGRRKTAFDDIKRTAHARADDAAAIGEDARMEATAAAAAESIGGELVDWRDTHTTNEVRGRQI